MSKPVTNTNLSMVPIDHIVERTKNPRQTFDPTAQAELENSIRAQGILQPLLLRPLDNGLFDLVAGGRRLRAAKTVGLTAVPAYIRTLDDQQVEAARLVENLHRVALPYMEEAAAFRALLKGRSLDEVAAIACKEPRYVRERVLLTELIEEGQKLVSDDQLPLTYATRIARIPLAKQKEALDQCFLPLFKGENRRREHLRPLRDLDEWLNRNVRLDVKSPDTAVFLPELVDRVQRIEAKKDQLLLHLSTLRKHVERSTPPLLLAGQWRYADSKDNRCQFAREGVIELGEGRGQVIKVCVAKEECRKHWPRPNATAASARAKDAEERRKREAAAARAAAAERQWKEELKPAALNQLTAKVRRATLTRDTFDFLLRALNVKTDELAEYVGPLAKLSKEAFVGALIVGVATRHGWGYDAFRPIAKRFGLRLAPPTAKASAAPNAA